MNRPPPYFPQNQLSPPDEKRYRRFKVIVGALLFFLTLFAIAAGIFSLLGGINNWDWFMKSFRAGIFVKTIGRQGARVVYGILGVVMIVIGVLLLLIG